MKKRIKITTTLIMERICAAYGKQVIVNQDMMMERQLSQVEENCM